MQTSCMLRVLPQSLCAELNQTCFCTNPGFNDEVSACVERSCTVQEGLTVANMTSTSCGFTPADNTTLTRFLTGFVFILPVVLIIARLADNTARGIHVTYFGVANEITRVLQQLWRYPLDHPAQLSLPYFRYTTTRTTAITTTLTVTVAIARYSSRDIWTLQQQNVTEFLKIIFVTEAVYVTGLAAVKASICFFTFILWVTQGSNAPFTLVYLMLIFAQCRPLSTYWLGENSGDKGACMDLRILVLIQVGLNVLLDVWMLVLPLTQLYKLNLKSCEKIGVIFIFSIGIL
ncbi:CFEM domain-containing protein [Colletotrichum incanum]|nr:CFEM domain-containing protein [Colletotrichum incanum]